MAKQNNEIQIEPIFEDLCLAPLFATPVMSLGLDLDVEKLTEWSFQLQNKDNEAAWTNHDLGGWHSNNISEEIHEEFGRLKKEITQYLQIYHTEVFQGMQFKKNVIQEIDNMWVNINEKHHYNDWHIHPFATLSGVYYIKHDGDKNGDILFKHPEHPQITALHWSSKLVESYNATTASTVNIKPKSNMLLIFPSWLNHSVGVNLNDDPRISLSFNSILV